jgi:hypothetical protein
MRSLETGAHPREPRVRILLPPARSQVRTCLPRVRRHKRGEVAATRAGGAVVGDNGYSSAIVSLVPARRLKLSRMVAAAPDRPVAALLPSSRSVLPGYCSRRRQHVGRRLNLCKCCEGQTGTGTPVLTALPTPSHRILALPVARRGDTRADGEAAPKAVVYPTGSNRWVRPVEVIRLGEPDASAANLFALCVWDYPAWRRSGSNSTSPNFTP